MSLHGTSTPLRYGMIWCQCILRVDTAAGTLAGRERLGCPQASMGRLLYEVNPLRYPSTGSGQVWTPAESNLGQTQKRHEPESVAKRPVGTCHSNPHRPDIVPNLLRDVLREKSTSHFKHKECSMKFAKDTRGIQQSSNSLYEKKIKPKKGKMR